MKQKINELIDWFEDKFNFIIDTIALMGGAFMIILSIIIFVLLIIDATPVLDMFEYIVLPGAIGFFWYFDFVCFKDYTPSYKKIKNR